MRLRKIMVCLCVMSALLLIGLTASASASSRTAISVKKGAGADPIGLEIEYRFDSGFAIGVAGGGRYTESEGGSQRYCVGAVTGRYYLTCGKLNPFISLGAMGLVAGIESGGIEASAAFPGVLGTAGVEVMLRRVRLAGELGYGVFLVDDPETKAIGGVMYGVSLGLTF
ncbi:MAG: hypothetical protein PHP20_04080 [Firmicutes bacterium]|jgi:hypothetical protein|nr:hypothetical protein [Bacillota bacterium]MDD4335877.1 hypothetical protein [Bacillota bacterium]MDD4792221.1 hypothetical protein [Bacillota bacterium]